MSACPSPRSLKRRSEPAVAVKARLRPWTEMVCLVTESAGNRRWSAGGGAGALPRSEDGPDFVADPGKTADGCGDGCGLASWAHALPANASIVRNIAKWAKRRE